MNAFSWRGDAAVIASVPCPRCLQTEAMTAAVCWRELLWLVWEDFYEDGGER